MTIERTTLSDSLFRKGENRGGGYTKIQGVECKIFVKMAIDGKVVKNGLF